MGWVGMRIVSALALVSQLSLCGITPGLAAGRTSDLPPDEFASEAARASFDPAQPPGPDQSPLVLRLQVMLDRVNASPGVIDGYWGDNVAKAVAAAEEMAGLPVDGALDEEIWRHLVEAGGGEPLIRHTITEDDLKGPFIRRIPEDYSEQAEMKGLGYTSPEEMFSERFHMDIDLLRQLNPGADFSAVGADILVTEVGGTAPPKVARVVADKARRQVRGYDKADRLVTAYPATIGSEALPSPSGTHKIKVIVPQAEYWYRPDVNFKQGDNDKPLRLPPGPNNPIGAIWIDLTEPTYGIHGTPEPSKIDKTNSHGCVRLTNWDALDLGSLVSPGVPVTFVE
jgi:lipoprotein-anchoring transpeptidase ErfK/SrfK